MKDCAEYEILISALLDGEVTREERAQAAAHLAACPACRQYFDDLTAIRAALEQEEAPVPAGFSQAVMARVRATAQDPVKKAARSPRWPRRVALAACCALAALGIWRIAALGGRGGVYTTDSHVLTQAAPYEMAEADGAAPESAPEDAPAARTRESCDANSAAGASEPEPPAGAPAAPAEEDGAAKENFTADGAGTEPAVNGDGGFSAKDAKEAALAHAGLSAGQAVFTRVELTQEDGRQVYAVEFCAGDGTEYGYEIDAGDGTVLRGGPKAA